MDRSLRRDCAEKRNAYLHARTVYEEALRLHIDIVADVSALRGELNESLMAYYAAHSALHRAIGARPHPSAPLLRPN